MYTDIFVRICRVYVEHYHPCAFRFIFDDDREEFIGTDGRIVTVRIHNAEQVFMRVFTDGSKGLGESYCEGFIEVVDVDYVEFVAIFVRISSHKNLLFRLSITDAFHVFRALYRPHEPPLSDSQSLNINHHYSLQEWFKDENDANEFYLAWLESQYIQYSCGKWDADIQTLEESQINKLSFYARRLDISGASKGKKLLDLGCGW